jgi:hypothetical protein
MEIEHQEEELIVFDDETKFVVRLNHNDNPNITKGLPINSLNQDAIRIIPNDYLYENFLSVTEKEQAKELGLYKIYDAGQRLYIKYL